MKLFNKNIDCIKDGEELYLPFDALKVKFGLSQFGDNIGYAKPILNVEEYDKSGDYLKFSKLSVEGWDIVSLDEKGIPKNNFRWGEYYYPITIAHYGLELFGKYLGSSEMVVNRYMGNEGVADVILESEFSVVSVDTPMSTGFLLSSIKELAIKELEIIPKGVFRVYFDSDDQGGSYCVYEGDTKIISGLQYLSVKDFQLKEGKIIISNIKLRGAVDVSVPSNSYCDDKNKIFEKALNIANWFVDNQNPEGVWESKFDHMFYKGRTDVMESGWPSGLGQGLALSFLTRMYSVTNDDRFLVASKKALKVFTLEVEHGGILRSWSDEYPFYEEYPTNPASFVLNGFIYSLLGLYDLSKLSPGHDDAKKLFEDGLATLRVMLPLYDLGDRSAYDLSHYSCGAFPNVARWGYHDTHLNLLMAVYSITNDEFYKVFYDRWLAYAVDGYRCRHN